MKVITHIGSSIGTIQIGINITITQIGNNILNYRIATTPIVDKYVRHVFFINLQGKLHFSGLLCLQEVHLVCHNCYIQLCVFVYYSIKLFYYSTISCDIFVLTHVNSHYLKYDTR